MEPELKASLAASKLTDTVRAAARAVDERNRARVAAEQRSDWQHLTDEGKRAKIDAIDAPMLEAERSAFEAEAEARKVADELERYGNAPAQLPDDQLARANALALFIREDVEADRSGEATAAQLVDAIAEGDKARVFCIARYTRQRLDEDRKAGRSTWGTPELMEALRRADVVMACPKRAKARDEAVALRKAAFEARQKVHDARAGEHAASARAHVQAIRQYSF